MDREQERSQLHLLKCRRVEIDRNEMVTTKSGIWQIMYSLKRLEGQDVVKDVE